MSIAGQIRSSVKLIKEEFKSKAQMRFLYSQHPDIAKRWRKKYGPPGDIPERRRKEKKT